MINWQSVKNILVGTFLRMKDGKTKYLKTEMRKKHYGKKALTHIACNRHKKCPPTFWRIHPILIPGTPHMPKTISIIFFPFFEEKIS